MSRKVISFVAVWLCVSVLYTSTVWAKDEQWATIVVAFGTSMPEAKKSLQAVFTAYEKKGTPVIIAYTSDIIRKKLKKKGEKIFSVYGAMNEAAAKGFTHLRIQSLHVGVAAEFHSLQRMIEKNLQHYPGRFAQVFLGAPLMQSERDMYEVRDTLLRSLPKERAESDAVIFMGHGNAHGPGDIMLYALGKAFQEKDALVYVAAVEGSSTFARVLEDLKKKGITRAWLQPFMVVAGDHARNDMAGPEQDSWASQLQAAGIEPKAILLGMGELAGIQAVFLRHTKESIDDMVEVKKSLE